MGIVQRFIPTPQDATCSDRHCFRGACPDAKFTFAFIRHPLTWYESWWKYSTGRPHNWDQWQWHPTYPLQACRRLDFGEFIEHVVDLVPGFLVSLFESYIGPLDNPIIDFVGRQERLAEDFAAVLNALGIPYDETVLDELSPQNVSRSIFGAPIWTEKQEASILEAEEKIIRCCYAN